MSRECSLVDLAHKLLIQVVEYFYTSKVIQKCSESFSIRVNTPFLECGINEEKSLIILIVDRIIDSSTFAAGQRSEIGRYEVPTEVSLPGFGIVIMNEDLYYYIYIYIYRRNNIN